MSVDVVAWTEEGRVALAKELSCRGLSLRGADEGDLRRTVTALVRRFGPCWQRGGASSDDVGRAAVAFACGEWEQALGAATVEEVAGMASLLGARSDDDGGAFTEIVLRRRGIGFALGMLASMWSLVTNYSDPDWPHSEERLAIWLKAISPDHSSSQDTSVSHGKGDVAYFLAARHRDSTDEARAEAVRAASELWAETPMHTRPALACAVEDVDLAEEIASDLFAGKTTSHPSFGWQCLPTLIRSRSLLDRLHADGHFPFTYRGLDALGAAALPYYDDALGKRATGSFLRERMIEQLVNVRGPVTASILARFADKAPLKKGVRAYFARYPELRDAVLDDAKLAAFRGAVEKLTATARKGKARRP